MKNTIFSFLLTLLFINAQAGPLHLRNMTISQRREAGKHLRDRLLNVNCNSGAQAKPTQLAERLLAQTAYMGPWELDSMYFTYHGDLGSTFNFSAMAYITDYELDGGFPFYFNMMGLYTHENDRPEVQADSMKIWYADLFTPFSPLAKVEDRISQYDANRNVISLIDQYVDTPATWNTRYLNTFNALHQITSSVYQEWANGWDSIELRIFTYDNNHYLVQDSTSQQNGPVWEPIEKNAYQYSAGGYLVKAITYYYNANMWNATESYTMGWDASNHLNLYIDSTNGVSGWEILQLDTIHFVPPYTFYTYIRDNQYSNGILSDYTVSTKHVTGGLVDTVFQTGYDGSGNYMDKNFTKFFYDAYNQPTKAEQYYYDDTAMAYAPTPMYTSHWYYQLYNLAVENTNIVEQAITLYPNPANDVITICTGTKADGRIELYNLSGQLMSSANLTNGTATIGTALMPMGLYLCKVALDGQVSMHKVIIGH